MLSSQRVPVTCVALLHNPINPLQCDGSAQPVVQRAQMQFYIYSVVTQKVDSYTNVGHPINFSEFLNIFAFLQRVTCAHLICPEYSCNDTCNYMQKCA